MFPELGDAYTSSRTPIQAELVRPDLYSRNSSWHGTARRTARRRRLSQRFSSAGAQQGSEFQINTYTISDQANPALCCDGASGFVVAWRSDNQDGDARGVFGPRFSSTAAPQGTEFQVNTYTVNAQQLPALCCDDAGGFVVAWDSVGQDGSNYGVFGQRFSDTGAAQGGEFQVNTYAEDIQNESALCCGPGGSFVVAWASFQDGSSGGIFAQRFGSAAGSSSVPVLGLLGLALTGAGLLLGGHDGGPPAAPPVGLRRGVVLIRVGAIQGLGSRGDMALTSATSSNLEISSAGRACRWRVRDRPDGRSQRRSPTKARMLRVGRERMCSASVRTSP